MDSSASANNVAWNVNNVDACVKTRIRGKEIVTQASKLPYYFSKETAITNGPLPSAILAFLDTVL